MRMRRLAAVLFVLSLLVAPQAHAVQPDEILPNAANEARARTLSKELRCMVCQNQSIDDSDAPLARDLRLLVRERITAGDSDQQVLDYLVSRYGEFVLLRPPFNLSTILLWAFPPVLLAGGLLLFLVVALRRRRQEAVATAPSGGELSPVEQEKLSRLLDKPGA